MKIEQLKRAALDAALTDLTICGINERALANKYFLQGASWLADYLSDIPIDRFVTAELSELQEELNTREE